MAVLLYIFAAIGAVATIGGVIALIIDAAQTNEDMQYYPHTRFPELEKDISVKLAEFETKLNNEGFVHKDQYDEDWNQFDYHLNTITDNMYELDKRLDAVADDNGGVWNKIDEIKDYFEKSFVTKDDYHRTWTENKERVDHIAYRLNDVEGFLHVQKMDKVELPRTITGNSPYDIHLTKITVGDDPNQMSKGTTV